MKAINLRLLFFCLLTGIPGSVVAGQDQAGSLQYRVMTDRDTYVAGEMVRFRVFNLNSESLRELEWSRVYYLEFISPDGNHYVQMKLPLDSSGTYGSFAIPREVPSGTYYLKGYTRFMRNLGPSSYNYLSIRVVNPFLRSILPVDTASIYTVPLHWQDWDCSFNDSIQVPGGNMVPTRSRFQPDIDPESLSSIRYGCITAARAGVISGQWEFSAPAFPPDSTESLIVPETRGITLTGKVLFSESGIPVPYAVVYITTLNGEREFYCNYTDSLGKFYIVLTGRNEESDLFISAANSSPKELEIFIDQDFCTEPVHLPSYPFSWDSSELEMISELSVNAQIGTQYKSVSSEPSDPVKPAGGFFYGEPSATILFRDFIKLPTLEEYFSEVIPQVTLRRAGEERKFRVWGSNPDLQYYNPLMMVDGVAVFDIKSVLAISPRYIDRVELVTAPYIKGNVTFGGIINLITTEGNMGFMDLPASGLLVNYTMFHSNPEKIVSPPPSADPRLPDVRNTLVWETSVEPVLDNAAGFGFSTADDRGRYCILIRGYDTSDHYLELGIPFLVR